MSIGFSSAARNLFLLGSSGEQVVTNFFKTIDQSAGTDGVYLPDEIKYNFVDQKFVLAGSAEDSNSKGFGWFEKRDQAGTADFENRIESTQSGINTTLRAMELDSNDNLIVVGKTGDVPWIAKYSNGGVIDWQATTNSGDVEYTGVTSAVDTVTNLVNYYACGTTPTSGEAQAFVEKFDVSGNPGWGKSAFMLGRDVVLNRIAANARGEVVAVGYLEDNIYNKGYIIKIDTNTGEVLWDRTLSPDWQGDMLNCSDVYIDSNDQIYVTVNGTFVGYLIKYTAEGNMIWQKTTDDPSSTITFDQVKSDGETEQTVVFGTYDDGSGDVRGVLSKYSKDGSLVWRRTLLSTYNNSDYFSNVCLDADPSFYYLLFVDDVIDGFSGTPDRYTFGKVSSSGNGLGAFSYSPDAFDTLDYIILSIGDKIGRLSDGSVRQDTSDLITYPFNANKILFDDLATQVSNKKRQMDSADSFEYSGSPAIRPPDFAEFSLGESQSGRDWYDLSGNNRNGKTVITEPYLGWGSVSFDGTGDHLLVDTSSTFDYGTNNFTIEFWWYRTSNDRQALFHGSWGQDWSIGIDFNGASNNQKLGMWASSSGTSWDMLIADGGGNGITTGTPALNQWSHIAYVRNGSDFQLYLNGTSVGQVTNSSAINSKTTTRQQAIGAWWNSEIAMSDVHGYLSNFRIVIGSAIYTSNFTPPTEPLTRVSGTKLLTCQGDAITDGGQNALSITANGNAAVTADGATWNSSGWWQFQTRSGAVAPFPGTAIDLPRDYQPDLITSGFTASWWQRGTTTGGQAAQFVAVQGLMQIGNSDAQQSWRVERNNFQPNTIEFGLNDNGVGFTSELRSNNFPDGEWIHVTIKWDGTTQYIYKNGVLDTSAVFSGTPYHHPGGTVRIGSRQIGAPYAYNGDIAEFRIWSRSLTATQIFQDYNATKSKYIDEAPDIAPKIGPGIVYDSNLLLNYDFGNRATYDRAENLLPWSEDFTKWNQAVHFWENNYAIAPDGSRTAALLKESIPPQQQLSYFNIETMPNVTVASGDTFTFTVFAKANTHNVLEMHMYGDSQANFNLTTGVTTNNGASMSAVGDGWYFCKWTRTKSNTNGAMYLGISANTYAGVGVDKSLFIWHPQVERGYEYGRYIRTSGTSINAPTTVKNLSSSSYTGPISGGAAFNSNGYFEFDGVNQSIDLTYTAHQTTAGTLEVWYRSANTNTTTLGGIIGVGGNGNTGASRIMRLFSREVRFLNYGPTGTVDWDTGVFLNDNTWYHLVYTWNGTAANFYRNNTGISTTLTGLVTPQGDQLRIARSPFFGNYLLADIGEARHYNRALTATEVSQNFNATRAKYGV